MEQAEDQFRLHTSTVAGKKYTYRLSTCKACAKRYQQEWNLRRKYGIGLEEFKQMRHAQGDRCALCDVAFDGKLPNVDHCHKTGRVRGLLCSFCNRALGMFKDNPEVLMKAANYVKGKFA